MKYNNDTKKCLPNICFLYKSNQVPYVVMDSSVKVKEKFTVKRGMKAQRGNRRIAILFL